nr:MAG: hypothetical protein [Prevotella phage R001]DAT12328.1 MAG TPA: hypothetical protein [Crassvirales sp.]
MFIIGLDLLVKVGSAHFHFSLHHMSHFKLILSTLFIS